MSIIDDSSKVTEDVVIDQRSLGWNKIDVAAEDIGLNMLGDVRIEENLEDDVIANDGVVRRRRQMTDKGKQHQQEVLKDKRKKIHARMTRKFKLIEELMYSANNAMTVREETLQIDDQFKLLIENHKEFTALLPVELREEEDNWFDTMDEYVFTQKHKIYNWLKINELDNNSKSGKGSKRSGRKCSKSGSEVSSRSSKLSNRSKASIQDKALEEKLKMAELSAVSSFIEEKHAANLKADLLRTNEEIAKAKARSEVFMKMCQDQTKVEQKLTNEETIIPIQNIESDKNTQRNHLLERKDAERRVIINPKSSTRHIGGKDQNIHEMLVKMLQHQGAPDVELECFNGDPLEYYYFEDIFTEVVEKWIPDPKGRLLRLLKYTKGEAHDLIKHCVQEPEYIGYSHARSLLKKRYGDPHIILSTYRKEVMNYPAVKYGDSKGFRQFYNFLIKCQSVAKENSWNAINTPDILCMLVSKLPNKQVDAWNRNAHKIRKHRNEEPNLNDFIEFIDQETTLVNDPMFSREAINQYSSSKTEKQAKTRRFKAMATEVTLLCKYCNQNHEIDECPDFKLLSVKERSKYFYKMKLCYGCSDPISEGHNSRTCIKRKKCSVCNKSHPTSLHGLKLNSKDKEKEREHKETNVELKVNTAEIKYGHPTSQVISMCIVPVKVRCKESGNIVEAMAMLDNCSQGCFVKDSLLKELEVTGTNTTVAVKTIIGEQRYDSVAVDGLEVSAINESDWINLPRVFTQDEIPVSPEEIATPEKLKKWPYLNSIIPEINNIKDCFDVKILIGANCVKALEPKEVISSNGDGPYAVKTKLGWCIIGPIATNHYFNPRLKCHRIAVCDSSTGNTAKHHFSVKESFKEEGVDILLKRLYHADFTEPPLQVLNGIDENVSEVSADDIKFLALMKKDCGRSGNHFELPLPLQRPEIDFPNNRFLAEKRLRYLSKRFDKDEKYWRDYKKFMDDLFEKDYAREIQHNTNRKAWYIPHHGVYHPQKPNKIRVVFDCSSEFKGYCLNKELLSGPDLTNQVVGVLARFRENRIGFMADIESMFYQVRVKEEHRRFLSFLWWKNGNIDEPIIDCEMNVHVFGATSSPGCSNYALRKTAKEYEDIYGKEAAETLQRNFYVDDLLKSVQSEEQAIELISKVKGMCKAGGFNLTKFISSSKKVLQAVPANERRKIVKHYSLSNEVLPTETALGIQWNVEEDEFTFKVKLKDEPITRRGILSTLSAIYDPLGFIAPFILPGKKILQRLCQENVKWDEAIPEHIQEIWKSWKENIQNLKQVAVKRCYFPVNFKRIKHCSLHHFSDASEEGYGEVTYIRFVDEDNEISCNLVISKSRVAPLKFVSIPRLELTAATLAVKISQQLKKELDIKVDEERFWTDSKVVLAYINNTNKRFKTFVANRIQQIKFNSNPSQWHYIETKKNPADDCSRGISLKRFTKVDRWIHGPEFLWKPVTTWAKHDDKFLIDVGDKEIKTTKIKVYSTKMKWDLIAWLEHRISSWNKMVKSLAYVLVFIKKLKAKISKGSNKDEPQEINVSVIEDARLFLLKVLQEREFGDDMKLMLKGKQNHDGSPLKNKNLKALNSFLDDEGIIRVGGRLQNSNLDTDCMHPIILPKGNNIVKLIVKSCHERIGHCGRSATLQEIRRSGYWIISCNALVREVIFKCVKCRSLRGKLGQQIMANLPHDRVNEAPPFTYCGVDIFGPFIIKERRNELKRYGALFTCLASRSVHIEVVNTMETDSFIMALRRMIARRGNIRMIRSDNGTNFVGTDNELKKAFQEMNHDKIKHFLLENGADWIVWKRNTPTASHMGGVWERQIRSARNILRSLLKTHGRSLNNESLYTLMTEVEAILNSRPLTVESISDGSSLNPICPSNLLTMKSNVIMPPPGVFSKPDLYCRRRWRRVQHISEEFWTRWRKEFLVTLQERQKWFTKKRNFKIGDIVLLKDEQHHRNHWPMAVIINTNPDQDGNVRNVVLRMGSNYGGNEKMLMRPISKIVLLLEVDENDNDSPSRSHIDISR